MITQRDERGRQVKQIRLHPQTSDLQYFCKRCNSERGRWLPPQAFPVRKNLASGRHSECYECTARRDHLRKQRHGGKTATRAELRARIMILEARVKTLQANNRNLKKRLNR